jgi:hypothetical protein
MNAEMQSQALELLYRANNLIDELDDPAYISWRRDFTALLDALAKLDPIGKVVP